MKNKFKKDTLILLAIIVFLCSNISPVFAINSDTNYINNSSSNFIRESNNDNSIEQAIEDMHIMSLSAGIIIDGNLEWYNGYGNYRGYYNFLVPESNVVSK